MTWKDTEREREFHSLKGRRESETGKREKGQRERERERERWRLHDFERKDWEH